MDIERINKILKLRDKGYSYKDICKELIAAREEKTMKDIEKRFGIGDNCIRKWCDKYNLPRKIKELKKIAENICL